MRYYSYYSNVTFKEPIVCYISNESKVLLRIIIIISNGIHNTLPGPLLTNWCYSTA